MEVRDIGKMCSCVVAFFPVSHQPVVFVVPVVVPVVVVRLLTNGKLGGN